MYVVIAEIDEDGTRILRESADSYNYDEERVVYHARVRHPGDHYTYAPGWREQRRFLRRQRRAKRQGENLYIID